MNRWRWFTVCLLLGIAHCAAPKPNPAQSHPHTNSDINERFKDPGLDVQRWVERWESESREIYANRAEIVAKLDLEPGMSVADVGAGTGLFVEALSEAVGANGRVYALDIALRFVEHIRDRIRRAGLSNVKAILSGEESVALPAESVDVVLLCDTYHHFTHPAAMLHSIRRSLRPGGQLVVIDFERIEGESRAWVLGHVRAGKEVFTSEIEGAGFALLGEIEMDGFRENYFLRFERR